MSDEFSYVGGAIKLRLDTRMYRLAAIKKAAYRLADRCTAVFGAIEEECVEVTLTFRANTTEAIAREVARLFFEELLDQELREHVAEETGPLQSLILAQAFSKIDLIRRQ